ncbi:hypothetical protein [Bradyrhizobium sp. LTSPM299]|uniref:hypothetical protein n=1 Tax=Bradyrhizobium sp. LTSPM299 TaxID=1619233 RepID=UPI0005CA05F2|nr:hypothetical protein [Bradyrhizobium sp. LTSPM299]
MAHYDPETLMILRKVLDDAWASLPDGSRSETLKSEMAQRILKQAADGVRDPASLRASALFGAVGEAPASKAKPRFKRRPRIVQTATFDERMASEAQRLKKQAKTLAPGRDREMLLRKARQIETAVHISEWLSSPGLMSPK